jgi:dTDP-4-dehydrorhamnose reductase
MKQLVMITGAGGQLGEAMALQMAARHEIVALHRHELDLADGPAVFAAVGAICPDVIVNCAAYTNVDAAEREPLAALSANAWAVRALARAANEINATLVHFSTDFVFDGVEEGPHTEDDVPNPRGVYATSKLLGEWFAAEAPESYVLRVESLFGGPKGKSTIDRILQNILSGTEVRAFADRTVSPSYVEDVVAATMGLLEKKSPSGLYHCVNSGWTTWAGVAHELAAITGRPDAPIREVSVADVPLVPPRPKFAALSNRRLTAPGIEMPSWQSALRRHVESLEKA